MLTVTDTGAEVVALPAASNAFAVYVWVPLLAEVSATGAEYGAEVSVLSRVAPSRNSTRTTPTLSVAVAVNVIVPALVTLVLDEPSVAVGGVVSAPPPLPLPVPPIVIV